MCKPGNGGLTVDTVGGMTLLRNRKRRYLTLMAFNGDGAKTIDQDGRDGEGEGNDFR